MGGSHAVTLWSGSSVTLKRAYLMCFGLHPQVSGESRPGSLGDQPAPILKNEASEAGVSLGGKEIHYQPRYAKPWGIGAKSPASVV